MAKTKNKKDWGKHHGMSAGGGGLWFGGFIGALVYYWGSIESFSTFIIAVFKAVLWPAYLVYELLRFLGA